MTCQEAPGTAVFQVILGVIIIAAFLAMLALVVGAVVGLWREMLR